MRTSKEFELRAACKKELALLKFPKMKLLHSILAVSVLACLLLLTTCKKHDLSSNGTPNTPPNYNNPNTANPVLASVAGTIVDENDNPLVSVTVRAAGKSRITDPQ